MRRGRLQKRGHQNEQCLERSRGGFSSKIHLLVDALGFLLQFILTGGERHDLSLAESLLAPFHFDAVIADKGYSSDPLRELLTAKQVEVVIPSRCYCKQPRGYDRLRYKERNIVERFINRINSSTEPSGIGAFSPAMKNWHGVS
ncbi:MAG: transposase [Caldilineaceae bacterium]|nr:transposase [Caldilineaceae bacterium]